ncbi:MFS transporter [Microlunatus sp. Gsoil 973]|uniref:MFS transporter n=1 Tax=Microlunatus sp. Gsoil 973 TaxID=2672569 RepID=UPI0018A7F9FE|nr:MFS transporter [Microlunatus sp. Gsoil 973]
MSKPAIEVARRPAAFIVVATVLAAFLAGASAPSPLYGVYARTWGFSPVTVTAVFAIYAIALLGTLLVSGTLSDALGRRPVILMALGLQSLAMALFLLASGVAWLYLARITQGVATGLVTAAVSAALLDLQPADRPGRGQ